MKPTAEYLNMKDGDNNVRRVNFVEAKVQQKDQAPDVARQECERILNYLHKLDFPQEGSRLLDLGCGTGRLTVELAERGYDAYGVDINVDFIDIAKDKANTRRVSTHFKAAQAEQLPFDDKFFDICIVFSVLEHVADWKKTVNEVARILESAGKTVYFGYWMRYRNADP